MHDVKITHLDNLGDRTQKESNKSKRGLKELFYSSKIQKDINQDANKIKNLIKEGK